MANIHILERVGIADPLIASNDKVRVALHVTVPNGNNAEGFPWKSVLLNAGVTGKTLLSEGTGAGQISPAERAAVLAGDVLELEMVVDVVGTNFVDSVQALRDEALDALQARYNHYGRTV